MSGFARLRVADPQLAKAVLAAVTALDDDLEPAESAPLGVSGLRRLRVKDARVLYQVDEQAQAVHILNVGRAGS